MLLAEVAATSTAVAGASGRRAKIDLLAERLRAASPGDLPILVSWLAGQPRQRRTGVGWAGLRVLPPAAERPSLTVEAVDAVLDRTAAAAGPGSATNRRELILTLLTQATTAEQFFLRDLLSGGVRQGAQQGLLIDAVAQAAGAPLDQVRREMTFTGDLAAVATALRATGPAALADFGLQVGRPLAPMLAQSAPDVAAALERTGPAGLEWKLDGVRVQVHRDGDDIAVFTRTLDEVTDRLPEVVETIRALPGRRMVLDGEVIALESNEGSIALEVGEHEHSACLVELLARVVGAHSLDLLS